MSVFMSMFSTICVYLVCVSNVLNNSMCLYLYVCHCFRQLYASTYVYQSFFNRMCMYLCQCFHQQHVSKWMCQCIQRQYVSISVRVSIFYYGPGGRIVEHGSEGQDYGTMDMFLCTAPCVTRRHNKRPARNVECGG